MKKRIAQLLLALCLVLPLLVVNAGAASSATSGTCGGEGDEIGRAHV